MSSRPSLPVIEFSNNQGLYTKTSPAILSPSQSRILQNADLFGTYGATTKSRGRTALLTEPAVKQLYAIDATNDAIDITDTGGSDTVLVTQGLYATGDFLAVAIQGALNTSGVLDGTFTVTYDNDVGTFDIDSTVAFDFTSEASELLDYLDFPFSPSGTNALSNRNTVPINWLGFYKYPGLTGAMVRQTIFQSDGYLYRLEDDGSVTLLEPFSVNLPNGRRAGIPRTYDRFDDKILVTGQDTEIISSRDADINSVGFKYDGNAVSPWGIIPPLDQEDQVIETFDDDSVWTSAFSTTANESDVTWDGDSVAVTSITDSTFYITNTVAYTPFAIPTETANRAFVHFHIPKQAYKDIIEGATGGDLVRISVSSGVSYGTNVWSFRYGPGEIVEGWNKLYLDLSITPATIDVTGTLDPTMITFLRFEVFNTGTSNADVTVYWDRFTVLTQGAPDGVMLLGDPATSENLFDFEALGNTLPQDDLLYDFSRVGAEEDGYAWIPAVGQDLDLVSVSTNSWTRNKASTKFTKGEDGAVKTYTNSSLVESVALDDTGVDSMLIDIKVGETDLAKLNTNGIVLALSSSADVTAADPNVPFIVDMDSWNIATADLVANQWVTITLDPTTPDAQAGNLDYSAINGIRISVDTTGTGQLTRRILVDNLRQLANEAGANTSCTVELSTVQVRAGTNSFLFTKRNNPTGGPNNRNAFFENLNLTTTFALSETGLNNYLSMYISDEDLAKLSANPIVLQLGTVGGSFIVSQDNFYSWQFTKDSLRAGWNALQFGLESAVVVGDPIAALIDQFRINIKTQEPEQTYEVYFDQMVYQEAPTFPPGDNGAAYRYKITYVDKDGTESNAGPFSAPITNDLGVDAQRISLTNIPTSDQPHVVARKIYRTVADGNLALFVDTIHDNVTDFYTDEIGDTFLGVTQPPEAGDSIDNSPPPRGGILKIWKRTAFMAGDPQNPHILYFSNDNNPDTWPVFNAFELDDKITGIFETYLGLVVATETAFWRVIGSNPNYSLERVLEGFGAVGPRAVGTARVTGWAADRDGLRLYDLRDTVKISEPIRDIWDSFDKTQIERIKTVHSKRDNSLIVAVPDANGDYAQYYKYQYAIDDIRTGWWSEIVIDSASGTNLIDMEETEDSNGDFHLYTAAEDGQIYDMWEPSADDWEDDLATTTAVEFDWQSPYIHVGSFPQIVELFGGSGRVRPRFIEISIHEASGLATNWTLTVDTAYGEEDDATPFDTETRTINFSAGNQFAREAMSITMAKGFRIRLQNNDTGVNVKILNVRVFIEAGEDQKAFPANG